MKINFSFLVFAFFVLFHSGTTQAASMFLKGINLSGAEFKGQNVNAKHYKDYVWPTGKNLERMKAFGFNVVRVPFSWERMQQNYMGPLNPVEAKQLDRIVQKAHLLDMYVIIDPHNYGQYKGNVLKPNQLNVMIFNDFWSRMAERYGGYPNVIYGLMNEPYKQTAKEWSVFAQVGVNAIRNAGAEQLILVPGTRWSGMHSWLNGGANSNAQALAGIEDPLENYAYEMHQYFDRDSSGTHHGLNEKCISTDQVVSKFKRVTDWLALHNKKAFLGEFGVQENNSCINALQVALKFMNDNQSEWVGWSYWAAGNWIPNYPYNIFSKKYKNSKRKQILKDALN